MPPKFYKRKQAAAVAVVSNNETKSIHANSGKTLVIVESPAKCKKIESYLGEGYVCMASYGHIREISDGLKSIDEENGFKPSYSIMSSKSVQVSKLREAIDIAADVLLATDDDREGEAIAWHICQVFKLPVSTTKRIVFHEITQQALKVAVASPRTINLALVHAQQARQVLDVLVGYKVSPVLWSHIARKFEAGLSAGRCQTPALRLVYDNAKEIEASPGEIAYVTTGYFTKMTLPFVLSHEFDSESQVKLHVDASSRLKHVFECSPIRKSLKHAPKPYSTSTLQQAANNNLHYSPKDTMSIAQTLYEGGYITYMRTDSKTYSREFVDAAVSYAKTKWCVDGWDAIVLPVGDHSDAAHEAIRPTDVSRVSLPPTCHPREHRLYGMIWENSLESCMPAAVCQSVTGRINVDTVDDMHYACVAETVVSPGWKVVAGWNKEKEEKECEVFRYFQTIKKGTVFPLKRLHCRCTLRNMKLHYSEAGLVQKLEKAGIGRPSTFSMLIDKIQERGYVKCQDVPGRVLQCVDYEVDDVGKVTITTEEREIGNEKSKLVIQPVGVMVLEFLVEHFEPLFAYDYTCKMEEELDMVASGGRDWNVVCADANHQIMRQIETLKHRGVIKEAIKIDDHHTYIIGKYGPVIQCVIKRTEHADEENVVSTQPNVAVVFKAVRPNLEYAKIKAGEYTLDEMLDPLNKCLSTTAEVSEDVTHGAVTQGKRLGEYDGKNVVLKRGKYGAYLTIGDGEMAKTVSLKGFMAEKQEQQRGSSYGKKRVYSEEDITLADVMGLLMTNDGGVGSSSILRTIDDDTSIRTGKFGPYIYYKTIRMKKPEFIKLKGFMGDYNTCDISLIHEWISKTREK